MLLPYLGLDNRKELMRKMHASAIGPALGPGASAVSMVDALCGGASGGMEQRDEEGLETDKASSNEGKVASSGGRQHRGNKRNSSALLSLPSLSGRPRA